MATIIFSSGSKITITESYASVIDRLNKPTGDFIEFKVVVTISPANQEKPDFTMEEPVVVNIRNIEQIF